MQTDETKLNDVRGGSELSPDQTQALADATSAVYMAPAWAIPAFMWLDEGRTMDAFSTGREVARGEREHRLFHGVAAAARHRAEAAGVSDREVADASTYAQEAVETPFNIIMEGRAA